MSRSKKLVSGVGVNDANYETQKFKREGDKYINIWRCPIYDIWTGMLRRCYSETFLKKYPSYMGCQVCEDWKTFSNFKLWVEEQDFIGKCLDKDLLNRGVRVYSPETCVFISKNLNSFLVGTRKKEGRLVGARKVCKKYIACCNDPFLDKVVHLGTYETEVEAHLVWKAYKHKLACHVADSWEISDKRIIEALKSRYAGEGVYEEV